MSYMQIGSLENLCGYERETFWNISADFLDLFNFLKFSNSLNTYMYKTSQIIIYLSY